ncbi:hypothetical protein ABNF97_20995 [Plantactinospora sp. B6F1]|uniref:hypothetical protein n=1 Tax=Plantactinospora sp. B6F1 TaxID=3158971 RepID=UPI00102C3C71
MVGGTGRADEISSILAALVALTSALLWVVNNNFGTGTQPARPDQLDLAVRELAETISVQWEQEGVLRGLRDTQPANIRWSTTGTLLTEPRGAVVPQQADGELRWRRLSEYESAILDLFDRAPSHRLVVLGDGAAGKSVFALLFTLSYLARRRERDPVPVMLSLSSWSPDNEAFTAWAERKLFELYPFLENSGVYGTKAARRLIDTRRIIFVLDGLDEIADHARPVALDDIERSLPVGQPLLLTCRTHSFVAVTAGRPALAGATRVTLHPLQVDDAITYLYGAETYPDGRSGPAPAQRKLSRVRAVLNVVLSDGQARRPQGSEALRAALGSEKWRPLFEVLRDRTGSPLQRVMAVPLYAALVRRRYSDGILDPQEFVRSVAGVNEAGIRSALIGDLLWKFDRPNTRGPAPPGRGPRTRWLGFMADRLRRTDQPTIEWWRLYQWLSPRQWALIAGIVLTLTYLLTIGFPEGLKRGIAVGMAVGIVIGLTRGSLAGLRAGALTGVVGGSGVLAVSAFLLDWFDAVFVAVELGVALGVATALIPRMQRSLTGVFQVGLLGGMAAATVTGLQDGISHGPSAGLFRGVTTVFGMGISIVFAGALTYWLKVTEQPKQPSFINISRARRERRLLPYLAFGTASGLAIGVGGGLVGAARSWFAGGLEEAVTYGGVIGLSYGLTAGFAVGLTGGYVKWITEPSAEPLAVTPSLTLSYGRIVALAYLVVPTVAALGTMLALRYVLTSHYPAVAGPATHSPNVSPVNGAALGASIGLVLACCFTPWPAFVLVRLMLWITRCGPLRMIGALERACDLEILRHDGAAYQFRHDEIRKWLLTAEPGGRGPQPATAAPRSSGAGP